MKNELKKVCKKDIEEIYNIIDPYLPDYNIFSLDQSIIYDTEKTIIYKTVRSESKEKMGKEIIIKLEDPEEIYIIKEENNKLTFKQILEDSKEKVIISIDDNLLSRNFVYSENNKTLATQEEYNLNYKNEEYKYNNSNSIQESFELLKSKNKVRKRD